MARAMAETFIPFDREWPSNLIIIEPKMPNNRIRTHFVLAHTNCSENSSHENNHPPND